MSLRHLPLRVRLGLSFASLAVFVTVVAWLSLDSFADANDRFVRYVEGINARALLADEIRTAVDRREIAARNLVLMKRTEDLEAERREAASAQAEVRSRLTRLTDMAKAPDVPEEVRRSIAAIDAAEQAYLPLTTRIVELAFGGQHDDAIAKLNTESRPHLQALVTATQAYRKLTADRARALVDMANASYRLKRSVLFAACLLAIGFATTAGALITRSVTRALGAEPSDLSLAAQRVSTGDLGAVDGAERAPTASVLFSIGVMQRSLASLVGQVRETSQCVLQGSAEIATGNEDLSHRTEDQVKALVQTTETLGQLNTTVQHNAGNAEQASRVAHGAREVAARGGEVVDKVVGTMRGISDSSRQIVEIIAVIDGIAFQTNILALNAAVEASRAGEHGRGFAVVAAEVRQLAQRSAAAAKEIKGLITCSVSQVQQGSELVAQAGDTMGEIVASIKRVSDLVSDISEASTLQSGGVDQISRTVAHMDQVTQQNAALVEQSAEAAANLKQQALGLVESVAVFKV